MEGKTEILAEACKEQSPKSMQKIQTTYFQMKYHLLSQESEKTFLTRKQVAKAAVWILIRSWQPPLQAERDIQCG